MQPTDVPSYRSVQLAPIASRAVVRGGEMINASGAVPPSSHRLDGTPGPKGVDGKYPAVLRVLVVEDDALIGALLAEMLEAMGHDVCAVESTEADAVAAAARCNPDLMIIDIRLGEGSGIAAVDEIHRTRPVAHVFVSGDLSSIQLLRPGAAMIEKPYREADLALVMQQALDTRWYPDTCYWNSWCRAHAA